HGVTLTAAMGQRDSGLGGRGGRVRLWRWRVGSGTVRVVAFRRLRALRGSSVTRRRRGARRGAELSHAEARRTRRDGDRRHHGPDRGRGGEAPRAVGAGAARVGVRGGAGAGAGAPGALDPAAEADRLRVRRRVVRGGVTGGPAGERVGGRGAEVGGEGRTRAREAGADLPPPPGSARGP